MKIKNGFISRCVAGNNVVVAVGERTKEFSGIIKLNESGTLLWDKLSLGSCEEELVEQLLNDYDVTREKAEKDVKRFIEVLRDAGAIED